MVSNDLEVYNQAKERIDVLVEGNQESDTTIVFVHGFGTDKNERGLFVDLSQVLSSVYRIVRFDFSGYGKSEGLQEEMSLTKMVGDLESVLLAVRKTFRRKIFIIAHSLGTIVTSMLAPEGIEKTIFTGLPHDDSKKAADTLRKRIESRGGIVVTDGITTYPRKDGSVQKLGPQFWKEYQTVNRIGSAQAYAQKTRLTLIKSTEDNVIDPSASTKWRSIASADYHEASGDHNFSDLEDREQFFQLVVQSVSE